MTPEQQIRQHADSHLGARGSVRVVGVGREANYHAATVLLTTPDAVERYKAWAQGDVIGMVLTGTTPLDALPLLTPCAERSRP